jgi:DNA-binding NarL/FixJ family response regulator
MSKEVSEAASSRSIEDWLKLIPQETAAGIEVAQVTDDGTVLIACKEGPSPEVDKLTNREYATLLLLAQSMSYKDIGNKLGMAENTVRIHRVGRGFRKLGVDRKEEAATFIPIEERKLRDLPIQAINGLSPRQKKVFYLIGSGAHTNRIAFEFGISKGTARRYRAELYKLLGVKDRVELQRFAGAMANLQRYVTAIAAAGQFLQPMVLEAIHQFEQAEPSRKSNLELSIEAALLSQPQANALMQDALTRPIAQTIIQQETAYYLNHE